MRFWCSNHETESANGNLFYGSKGHMVISGYNKWKVFYGRKNEPGPKGDSPTRHYENFIKAVRSHKVSDQNGPIETGHYSAAFAHLANTAFRRSEILNFDTEKERFIDNDDANKMLVDPPRKGFEVPAPNKV